MQHPLTTTGRIAALLAAALTLSACSGSSSTGSSSAGTTATPGSASASDRPGSTAASAPGGGESITIGSANFGESVLIADIYGEALKGKGVTVTQKPKIGSREVYIPALKDGSIDLIPEYSGTLLSYFDRTSTAASPEAIYQALPAAIGSNLKVLDQSPAQDADSITVNAQTAAKYNLKSIGDLKDHAADMVFGAAPEFKVRPDGPPGLKSKYDVVFGTFKALDAGGPLTVAALKNGQVDAADLFTTDPAIGANKFVVLADPKNDFTAQNVLPLISSKKATPTISAALNAVSAKLTTDTLVALNTKVADGADADDVAQQWLQTQGLT